MISPNCPMTMDETNATSSYSPKEINSQAEPICNCVRDGEETQTKIQLSEEQSQDAEDEDTLSDDSLRLRVSDDEADDREGDAAHVTTMPCVSSQESSNQNTTMGLTDSNVKVEIDTGLNSSMYKSHHTGSTQDFRKSSPRSKILAEASVVSSIHNAWRGGSRREHSFSHITPSPKRSLRGHSLHMRHSYSYSNIHKSPSYFNNQDNFGRPTGFRRTGSNWKYSKGKYVQGNMQNMQRKSVKEHGPSPESQTDSKSCKESDQLSPDPLLLIEQASSNSLSTDHSIVPSDASECTSTNDLDVPSIKGSNALPIVPNETGQENVDLSDNYDQQSSGNTSSCNDHPKHTCNESFNESNTTSDEQEAPSISSQISLSEISETFSGTKADISMQSCINSGSVASIAPKNNMTTDNVPATLENDDCDSSISMKAVTDAQVSSELLEAEPHKELQLDVPLDTEKEDKGNGLAQEEATTESNVLVDPSKSDKSCDTTAHLNEMPMSAEKDDNVDKTEKVKEDHPGNGREKKLAPNSKEDVGNERNIDGRETEAIAPLGQEAVEQPMEIATNDNIESETSVSEESTKTFIQSNNRNTKSEDVPQTPNIKKNGGTPCNEPALSEINNEAKDTLAEKLSEKSSLTPDSDVDMQRSLVSKRGLPDSEFESAVMIHKKMKVSNDFDQKNCPQPIESLLKMNSDSQEKHTASAEKCEETSKSLHYVRKFFQRDIKGKLTKLKREELEELIIQKLVETITMRSEIGRLREQARVSERIQDATRSRCQELAKQIKDFDMVLTRNAADRRMNNDKTVPPIKINRSVGLQVNFTTEQGIQNLRALSANNAIKSNLTAAVPLNGGITNTPPPKPAKPTPPTRRGLKVKSPRRAEGPKIPSSSVSSKASVAAKPTVPVVSKPADTSHNLSIPMNGKEQVMPNVKSIQPTAAKVQNMVVNGKVPHQVNRQMIVPNIQIPEGNDLIDLTEEEDKNKSKSKTSNALPMVGTVTSSIGVKTPNSRFHRAAQSSGNVPITSQPANIRVVQSSGQPTPTALVNNVNATRLAYVMQANPGTGRQLLIAPNPNQIRPVTSTGRGQFSGVAYKSAGVSTLANGAVRVLTTTTAAIPNSQPPPAPLPDTPHYAMKNGWKLPPPPPSLKISKVTQGIVLSWNMAQSDTYAEIASYQLYAYQEIPGTAANSNLWKKVGDVRALPLPMACTLKEFTPGNNYHFAVRAVDTHSRLGQYSIPRNISL